jgi:hypothetical protein
MVQALMGKDRELAEAWDVVVVGAEWVEIARVQVPREVAYVLAVEQRLLIRQALPAMI